MEIGETVRDHPGPRLKRGLYRSLHMVAARRIVQERFGHRFPAIDRTANQKRANLLGSGRTARLARQHDSFARRTKLFAQPLEVGAFSRPFPAFQSDEARGPSSHRLTQEPIMR